MPMAVCYSNFGGRIISEVRGGEERDYVRDTLGSTAELVDATGTVTDTFEYWPYGEVRVRSGITATPFLFVGTLGYFADSLIRLYVRARNYAPPQALWLTLDPLWPRQRAYSYVVSRPLALVDPSGLSGWDSSDCMAAGRAALAELNKCFSPTEAWALSVIMQCMAYGESDCDKLADNGSGGLGLYQLGDKELSRCCPQQCKGYGGSQIGCNTKAAIGLILRLFNSGSGASVGDELCRYWGVFDCSEEGRQRQNSKTTECLKAKGIDPFKMPVPQRSLGPGCDPCVR